MSKFLTKKQQQKKNHLALGLLGSILIHGLVVLGLSHYQDQVPESPELLQTRKPIEITIVEQPQKRSPEKLSTSQSKSLLSPPSPEAKASSVSTQATQSVSHQPEKSPTTAPKTLVKSSQISAQPRINRNPKQLDTNHQQEASKNAELLTKPRTSKSPQENSLNQKPIKAKKNSTRDKFYGNS
ncbi:MAG: hypothetical protein HC930_07190 [Hydrococcus sp. SU_1_0]|nr:hypothetical protein [Hydrococcus sp. SU_1_0]